MPALVLNIIITLAGNHNRKSTELKGLFLGSPMAIPHGRMWKIRTPGVNRQAKTASQMI